MFVFQSGAGRAGRVEIRVCLQRMTEVESLIFRVEQVGRADRVEIMMLAEDDRGCMFDFQSGAGRACLLYTSPSPRDA